MKCLLVPHSGTMRRILANTLREIGCNEIVDAPDGSDPLEQCDETTGMIITEWGQQETDAIELTKRIRAKEDCTQPCIIMVSSRNSKSDVTEAIEAGVNGYILKPFTVETLRLKLEQLLNTEESAQPEEVTPSPPESSEESPDSSDSPDTGGEG